MKHHIIALALLSVLVAPVFASAQALQPKPNDGLSGSAYTLPDTSVQSVTQPNSVSPAVPTGYRSGTVAAPSTVTATGDAGSSVTASGAPLNGSLGTGGNRVSTQGSTATTKLENPLKGVNSIGDFIYLVINFVYSLSYAVIAFFLLLSGFKFVMAQGKPDALDDAKTTFKYTIIGALLLIGANVITTVVQTVINKFLTTPI
jgi:hypothetical protein